MKEQARIQRILAELSQGSGQGKNAARKKAVVFLPYKASMWDSMESIWQAFSKDTMHCRTYVVPIPYADKTPEGTVREWHYEGSKFPAYVPIVSYQSLDLATMRPDVIFIHNPYDACNRVTSVDSHFYSSTLEKYTDHLVYVPYFVTGGRTVADGFCNVPGVFHANHVICESEAVKTVYESNYHNCGALTKGKFLALGSPKYDKVVALEKKHYTLPAAWQRLLGRKKVILYNTGLTALLEKREQWLMKLAYVLVLMQQRADLVLWWRPHPLIEPTLASMHPELMQTYQELKQWYLDGGWGIYDDSPDLDRAIVCTDAYYGDGSSVVWLYRATQKPVMLQEVNNVPPRRGNRQAGFLMSPGGICREKDHVWLVHSEAALLVCYSLPEHRVVLTRRIPQEIFLQMSSYRGIFHYRGRLFLVPGTAEHLTVYDIARDTFATIDYPAAEQYAGRDKFAGGCVHGHYLYYIPQSYPYILKLDMDNMQVEVCLDHLTEARKQAANANYINDFTQIEDYGFACCWSGTNLVLLYDMRNETWQILPVGAAGASYSSLAYLQGAIYLSDSAGNQVHRFSPHTQTQSVLAPLSDGSAVLRSWLGRELYVDYVNTDRRELWSTAGKMLQSIQAPYRPGCLNFPYALSLIQYQDDEMYFYDRPSCILQIYHADGTQEKYDFTCMDDFALQDLLTEQTLYKEIGGAQSFDVLAKLIDQYPAMPPKDYQNCGEAVYRYFMQLLNKDKE